VAENQSRTRRSRETGNRREVLSAQEIGAVALRCIAELTSRLPIGATAVARSDDGWVVDVEVIEDRRIPSTSDMLALYEVELDQAGELVSYRRTRRYTRGSTINGSEAS
jgi:hypothetical protein